MQREFCNLSAENLLTRKGIFPYEYIDWQRFSIWTFSEYSDLYLKTDVLLLADILKTVVSRVTRLDPAYYYILSSLHGGCKNIL